MKYKDIPLSKREKEIVGKTASITITIGILVSVFVVTPLAAMLQNIMMG